LPMSLAARLGEAMLATNKAARPYGLAAHQIGEVITLFLTITGFVLLYLQ